MSLNEKLMIACIIVLLILIATRFNHTVERVRDGFNYFKADSIEQVEKADTCK